MNNKTRKSRIEKIKNEIKILNDEFYDLISKCPHIFSKDGSTATCSICGKDGGWWCPKSKNHRCFYSEDEYGYDEYCEHCGQPDERK